MRKDVEEADRREDVRAAARAWRRAGAISEEAMAAIVAGLPDDRSRVGTAFRALLFFFALVAVVAGLILLSMLGVSTGPLFYLGALATIVVTEIQIGALRRWRTGSEEATALASLWLVGASLGWSFDSFGGEFPWRMLSLLTALYAAAAAWRWGLPMFGAFSAMALFSISGSSEGARLFWILLGGLLTPPLLAASTSFALAPSQRRAMDAAAVVCLLGLYAAVHIGSYDVGLIERGTWVLGVPRAPGTTGGWGGWERAFCIAATALLPIVVLASGIRFRRPLLLRMGVLLGVASLVTLRFYVHVAPLWVVLVVSGGTAIAVGLLLHRYLASGADAERHGFTAAPLFDSDSRARALEVGLSAALAPGTSANKTEFRGGGGRFGGGGASGTY